MFQRKLKIFVTPIPGPLTFLFKPPGPPILARINRVFITFIKLADRIELKNNPSPSQKCPLKGLKLKLLVSCQNMVLEPTLLWCGPSARFGTDIRSSRPFFKGLSFLIHLTTRSSTLYLFPL